MASITTTAIRNLLYPGLKTVFGAYEQYPAQWKRIYTTYHSDKAVELDVETKQLGLGQIRAEGAPTAVDTMGQRFVTTYIHRFVGLSFVITQQAMEDNLYESQFPQQTKSLYDSLNQSKEVLGAALLNNGFNVNYPIGDGQPVFSINHPIDTGVVANTPTVPTQLNEQAIESAISTIQQFQDQAGLIVKTRPMELIVPNQLQFTADRLLYSNFRPGTANNDIGVIPHMNLIPQGASVNQFLTSQTAWFIKTDASNGFKHFQRTPIKVDFYTDFSTDNLLCKAVERYSFGISNFRATYGSPGA